MTEYIVSGVSSGGITLNPGDEMIVESGGIASGTFANSGSDLYVSTGGSAVSSTISGGTADVYAGGSALHSFIFSGGDQKINNGGVAIATSLGAGGFEVVSAGGKTSFTVVSSGGNEILFGGDSISATVDKGGFETISAGIASGTTVESGGIVLVSSGGSAVSTSIASGGILIQLGGGVVTNTSASAGADVISSGVVTLGATGALVSQGATITGETVSSGATQYVLDKGSAVSTLLGSATATVLAGTEEVFSGGHASATSVTFGASAIVFDKGMAHGTIVESGGFEIVSSGGTTSDTIVSGGGYEVLTGGTSISATVLSGGFEIVSSGGVASATSVSFGGNLSALSGGITRDAVVSAGGTFLVSGGHASNTNLYGTLSAVASGVDDLTSVNSGGQDVVDNLGSSISATISAGGAQFVLSGGHAKVATVESGGAQVVSGGGIAAGTMVDNGGTEFVLSGGSAVSANVASGGALIVLPGAVVTAPATVTGALLISTGVAVVNAIDALVQYGSTAVTGTTLSNGSAAYVLQGGSAVSTTVASGGTDIVFSGGTIIDTTLLSGGTIDLTSVFFVSSGLATLDSATDVLSVTQGAVEVSLQLAGGYAGEYFHLYADSGVGTNIIVDGTPCYCRGTHILTDQGERAVEELAIGDLLITAAGEARRLRWIGLRTYSGRFAAGNPDVLPILIKQGAIAGGLPKRDLVVSPLHALFLDGALVPARSLVNDGSIVQVRSVAAVEYFHLELDSHDVILAEGVAAETYLDDRNRNMFHNAAEYHRMYPDAEPATAAYCAPRLESGPLVESLRAQLAARGVECGFMQAGAMVIELRNAGVTMAQVPAGVGELHLNSTSGTSGLDLRRLGALVKKIILDGVPLDLTDSRLKRGFYPAETHGGGKVRWTDGEAVVVLDPKPFDRWCEIAIGVVVEPGPAPIGCLSIPLREAGVTRVLVPAGVGELHLLSAGGEADGDQRRLGALVTGIVIGGRQIELVDTSLVYGFHPVESHGARTVRWTDGEAVVMLDPMPEPQWCEIEIAAVMAAAEELMPSLRAG